MSIKKFDEIIKEASSIVRSADIKYNAPEGPKDPEKDKPARNPKNVFTEEDERKFLDTLATDANKFFKIKSGVNRFARALDRAKDMYDEVKTVVNRNIAEGEKENNYNEGLAANESSGGKLTAVNGQYLGEFQLGNRALVQAGFKYRNKEGEYGWSKLARSHGVDSRYDFLHSENAQEAAMERYTNKNWEMIQQLKLDKYIGEEINGVKITENGLKYACHLVGIGNLSKALRNKEHRHDGNGVSCYLYMALGGLTQPGEVESPVLKKIEEMKLLPQIDSLKLKPLETQYDLYSIPEKLKTSPIIKY